MEATEDSAVTRTQARALSQRNRILEAARRCFIAHGFHAASMANIAEAAGMSAGLIYRYFDSENAIILAIIERQLQDSREGIAALHTGTSMGALFGEVFARWARRDETLINPALLLEMSALATRDAQIAEALEVRSLDADVHTEITRRYGVMAMPTLLVFKDGKVAAQQVGALVQKRKLEDWINASI